MACLVGLVAGTTVPPLRASKGTVVFVQKLWSVLGDTEQLFEALASDYKRRGYQVTVLSTATEHDSTDTELMLAAYATRDISVER